MMHCYDTKRATGNELTMTNHGRYNFFGWDSSDVDQNNPTQLINSYNEPVACYRLATRNSKEIVTLKYKRTQRIYFTNLGEVTERLSSCFINPKTANSKKLRVTWEGDGV